MSHFISGTHREQSTLFPAVLDDYIGENNIVRAIDVYIEALDLGSLGFHRTTPKATGRPAYSPATLLKIYLYGYFNKIQSSRRLERETQRNVELMWLTQQLTPDFKTIADFRKNNPDGIKNTCSHFIQLCRKLDLFQDADVAVDGSKFKAVNSPDKNFTQGSIKQRISRAEAEVDRYLAELDRADRQEKNETASTLKQKVTALKQRIGELQSMSRDMMADDEPQLSLTDPDSRSMKSRRIGTIVGYNVQSAVDTQHHLIVSHYVTNDPTDRGHLSRIAQQAQQAIDKADLTVYADRGYYNSEEVRKTQDLGMTPILPKTYTSMNKKKGLFTKDDFIYNAEKDVYICPAEKALPFSFHSTDHGRPVKGYLSVATCKGCQLKPKCTTSNARRVKRLHDEEALEIMQAKYESTPDAVAIRKSTVEHPFGTIKAAMGSTHYLMKGLRNVATETALHVLAYNFKRLGNILGNQAMLAAVKP